MEVTAVIFDTGLRIDGSYWGWSNSGEVNAGLNVKCG